MILAHGGRQPFPASVVLIATHADKVNCPRDSNGEYTSSDALAIYGTVREMFKEDFDIHQHLFVVDSHAATSAEVKGLKTYLNDCKTQIIKVSKQKNSRSQNKAYGLQPITSLVL